MRQRQLILALAAISAMALIIVISVHSPTTAHASPSDETNLADRVAKLERRLETLEKIVESLHSKKVKAEVNDPLHTARKDIAEELRIRVAEYLSAVADPSTDVVKIRFLGLEVDRHRKLLQAVVDKERQLERDSGVTKP